MRRVLRKTVSILIDQKLLVIIVVLLAVITWAEPGFLSFRNLLYVLEHFAVNGIMAAGMTVLLISGSFDLSVGAVLVFTGIITFLLQPFGLVISVVGGLLAGTAIGALNGLLVVRGKINPFIVTLGTLIIFRGLSLGLSNSTPIGGKIAAFAQLGQGSILGIYNPVWIMIIIYVATWYLLKYTRFGRNDYAVGGNPSAARLAGVNVELNTFWYFVFVSFTASIAGLVYSSRVNTASATYAPGIELYVIAAAVLGGASLFGGKGGVIGTIEGVIILDLVQEAMIAFEVDINYQSLVMGLIIIGVVVTDTLVSKRQERTALTNDNKAEHYNSA